MVPRTSPSGINAIKSYAKLGKKYTIAYFGPEGFVEQRCFVLAHISYKPYQEYSNPCLLISQDIGDTLKWDKYIRLWEGYHRVNTDRVVSRGTFDGDGGTVFIEKRWATFESRYMHRALESVKTEPIAHYVKGITTFEHLITYQCISERN